MVACLGMVRNVLRRIAHYGLLGTPSAAFRASVLGGMLECQRSLEARNAIEGLSYRVAGADPTSCRARAGQQSASTLAAESLHSGRRLQAGRSPRMR